MTSHQANQAMKEAIRSKIRNDLVSLFVPIGILDIDIKFNPENVKEITVTFPTTYKFAKMKQLIHLKKNGYKCKKYDIDNKNNQVLSLVLEKQI